MMHRFRDTNTGRCPDDGRRCNCHDPKPSTRSRRSERWFIRRPCSIIVDTTIICSRLRGPESRRAELIERIRVAHPQHNSINSPKGAAEGNVVDIISGPTSDTARGVYVYVRFHVCVCTPSLAEVSRNYACRRK